MLRFQLKIPGLSPETFKRLQIDEDAGSWGFNRVSVVGIWGPFRAPLKSKNRLSLVHHFANQNYCVSRSYGASCNSWRCVHLLKVPGTCFLGLVMQSTEFVPCFQLGPSEIGRPRFFFCLDQNRRPHVAINSLTLFSLRLDPARARPEATKPSPGRSPRTQSQRPQFASSGHSRTERPYQGTGVPPWENRCGSGGGTVSEMVLQMFGTPSCWIAWL